MNQTLRNVLIPLPDGVELAADLTLPDGAGPWPVILSYYPYHKDDVIGAAYEYAGGDIAKHGYGVMQVDFRGLGSSSGTARPAMDGSEAEDCHALVEWVAAQEWCDGTVGMWGVSYGGITSLRAAAARPPSLRAIVPMLATHDIYHHWFYPGGCPNLMGVYGVWGPLMLAFQLMPPMFHDEQRRWQQVWDHRLEHTRPYLLDWPLHPDFDDYWQSKVIPLEDIEVPTLLIGGWRDIFPEAMAEAHRRIPAERQLLIGPWMHTLPDLAPHDPVEFLPAMVAFFDRHMRGRESLAPAPVTIMVQGAGWRTTETWPPPATSHNDMFPDGDGSLRRAPGSSRSRRYEVDPTVGTAGNLFDPLGQGVGLPTDQAGDDAASLSFTSETLDREMIIAGSPVASLVVELDGPMHLVARLCDVAPSGRSSLITTGWLRVDESGRHDVRLWATAYAVPEGHQLRLAVSGADFPRIWPTAHSPSVDLHCGESGSVLRVPVADPQSLQPVEMPEPDPVPDRAPRSLDFEPRWRVIRDGARGEVTVETGIRSVMTTPSGDGRVAIDHLGRVTLDPGRPGDARAVARTTVDLETPSGAMVQVRSGSSATRSSLRLTGEIDVDGVRYFERQWER